MDLSPKELDEQSYIYLSGWVDLDSDQWRMVDEDPALTKKWIVMLMREPAYLHLDSMGRIWCKNNDGIWCPFHIESMGKMYGIRIPQKAAN